MSDFLQIGVRPQGVGSVVNLAPNPRFHDNVSDGWSWDEFFTPVHDTSPPVPLPEDVDACAAVEWGGGGGYTSMTFYTAWLPLPGPWPMVYVQAMLYTPVTLQTYPSQPYLRLPFVQFSDDGGVSGAAGAMVGEDWSISPSNPMDMFYGVWCLYESPSYMTATHCRVGFGGRFATGQKLYVTRVMVTDTYRAYYDGDSPGWSWTGAAHSSPSRTGGEPPTFHVGHDEDGAFIYAGRPGAQRFEVRRDDDGLYIGVLPGTAPPAPGGD